MEFEVIKNNKKTSEPKEEKFQTEQPKWSLKEVALSKNTLEQIDEMVAYTQNKAKLLNEWQFDRFLKTGSALSINFFGPPGTGKSITAEAIAHKLGISIIKINYGEVESSFIGGTSENLVSIFQKAEETKSLLFFDEADSVLSRRIANLSQAADHGVNSAKSTLLTLLDKFNGAIIFATNLFDNYDEAFVRRILFNVEFFPPDLKMREQLWRFHLSEKVPRHVSYEVLSNISDGLCGGDIKNIAIKLGLKLLAGNIVTIDEHLVKEEIKRHMEVKKRQHRPSFLANYSADSLTNSLNLD